MLDSLVDLIVGLYLTNPGILIILTISFDNHGVSIDTPLSIKYARNALIILRQREMLENVFHPKEHDGN